MTIILLTNLYLIYLFSRKILLDNDKKNITPFAFALIHIIALALYILLYDRYGYSIELVFLMLISYILIIIAFIDLLEMIIPDSLILLIIGLTIIYHFVNYFFNDIKPDVLFSLSGLLTGGLIFLIIILASRGGMGLGDVTLISSLGLILGPNYTLLNILLSFLLGSLISVFLLIAKLKSRKDSIAFGPFIISGFFISILYGDCILSWYLNLMTVQGGGKF